MDKLTELLEQLQDLEKDVYSLDEMLQEVEYLHNLQTTNEQEPYRSEDRETLVSSNLDLAISAVKRQTTRLSERIDRIGVMLCSQEPTEK